MFGDGWLNLGFVGGVEVSSERAGRATQSDGLVRVVQVMRLMIGMTVVHNVKC